MFPLVLPLPLLGRKAVPAAGAGSVCASSASLSSAVIAWVLTEYAVCSASFSDVRCSSPSPAPVRILSYDVSLTVPLRTASGGVNASPRAGGENTEEAGHMSFMWIPLSFKNRVSTPCESLCSASYWRWLTGSFSRNCTSDGNTSRYTYSSSAPRTYSAMPRISGTGSAS